VDRGAQNFFEEVMENQGFCLMRENSGPIFIVKVFNLVFPKASRSVEVKIASVVIAEGTMFYFFSLWRQ
jgi:hypothetical protein